MKTKNKKQRGFSLIELMVTLTIIGIISSIAIPAYQGYIIKTKWAKSIASIRALKIAVQHCLSENGVVYSACDELTGEIEFYGLSSYVPQNENLYSISLVKNTAAIIMTGKQPLADCVLSLRPSFVNGTGIINWNYTMTSGSTLADSNLCATYVKGSTAS